MSDLTEMPDPPRSRVLVVGQVPPPHHGQAIMVETLLRGSYRSVELVHVPADYSTSLDEIGRASAGKVWRMLGVVGRALRLRWTERCHVLYYHPAGANRSAVLRDLVVLGALRPWFPTVVFHHHARGLPGAVDALPWPLRPAARRALRRPDVSIAPSQALVDEVAVLDPARSVVIANGTRGGTPAIAAPGGSPPRILFLNLVSEQKGAHWLLRAVAELHRRGIAASVTFAGTFPSDAERARFDGLVDDLGLAAHVELAGLVTGDRKWETFAAADVFCVPTTYEQESFGLALVEAASCGLPVVTTDVPGVREVFVHGDSALLADPGRELSLADHLETVCTDADRRRHLGERARALFEERYTEQRFWDAVDAALAEVTHGGEVPATVAPC